MSNISNNKDDNIEQEPAPNPYILSTIPCEIRSSLCEELNPNKLNILKSPWLSDPIGLNDPENSFFNLNEFGLEDEVKVVEGLDKEECANIALENNYAGFIYYGDQNLCYEYDNDNFNSPIEDDIHNNYNISTFFKTQNTATIDSNDQHNYDKYFTSVETMGFVPSKYLNLERVPSDVDCMKSCVRNEKGCNGIMYASEPKKCIFYNKKVMKNKNNNEKGDVYTVISNKLKSHNDKLKDLNEKIVKGGDYNYCKKIYSRCVFDKGVVEDDLNVKDQFESVTDEDFIKNASVPLYNCGGIYSTNPFCTKQYDPSNRIQDNTVSNNSYYTDCFEIDRIKNQNEKKKFLNELCKDKYGVEYKFNDDIYNMNSIMKCGGDNSKSKKALCKMTFDTLIKPNVTDKIEHFNNNNTYDENAYSILPYKENIKEDDISNIFYNANMFKTIVLLLFFFIIGYLIYNIMYKC